MWTPRIFQHHAITPTQVQRGASYLLLFARLTDGVSIPEAVADVDAEPAVQWCAQWVRRYRPNTKNHPIARIVRCRCWPDIAGPPRSSRICAANRLSRNTADIWLARRSRSRKRCNSCRTRCQYFVPARAVPYGKRAFVDGRGCAGCFPFALGCAGNAACPGQYTTPATRIDIDATVLLYTALVAVLTGIYLASDRRSIRYVSTSMRF